MAEFTVNVEGKEYDVSAPDEKTAWKWANKAHDEYKGKVSKQLEADRRLYAPTSGMDSFSLAAAGVGKALTDAGRGVGQILGLVSQEDVQDSRQRDRALMETGAGMAGNIAGNVGMALAPGGLVRGAGALAGLAGSTRAAQGLNVVANSMLAPRTVTGALGGGAALGMIQPATSGTERLLNVGMGAVGNAAIPAVAAGWRGAKAAAEPFYETGKQNIVGRTIRAAAGDDADTAINAMRGAQPLVPGSLPTAGQAANNAGIAALERTASAIDPSVTVAYQQRMSAQNAARIAALEDMAGTGGARMFARTELESTAEDLYKNAFQRGMDLRRNPLTGAFLSKAEIAGRKGEITKLLKTPAMQDAVERAKTLAANEMQKIDDPAGSVLGLHYTKKALDDMIAGAQGNEQRVLINLRDRLVTTIDKLSPDYEAARKVYKEMAKPVNQMDTADAILKGSVTPRGNMTLDKFSRSATDKTAASAQKFRAGTLEGTMTPEQMQTLNNIRADLLRADFAQNAGRGVGSDTVQKLAYSNLIDAAGVPTWLRNTGLGQVVGGTVGRGADALYGRANREVAALLAETLLDPRLAAQYAGRAQLPSGQQSWLRYASPGVAMAAPGLLYGPKQ